MVHLRAAALSQCHANEPLQCRVSTGSSSQLDEDSASFAAQWNKCPLGSDLGVWICALSRACCRPSERLRAPAAAADCCVTADTGNCSVAPIEGAREQAAAGQRTEQRQQSRGCEANRRRPLERSLQRRLGREKALRQTEEATGNCVLHFGLFVLLGGSVGSVGWDPIGSDRLRI